MKLVITLKDVQELNQIRELVDKASIASYPKYSMDERSIQWHKPTLICVGTPNDIDYLKNHIFSHYEIDLKEEKGY